MKDVTERTIRKLGIPVLLMLACFAYMYSLQYQRVDAEEMQRLVDEVNAREERLNDELQPLIERNKRLDRQGSTAIRSE